MTEWIPFIISTVLVFIGMFAFASAAVGVFRFDHVLFRLHAAAIADTVGIACITLSAVVYLGTDITSLKELAVIGLMMMTSPVSTHLLAELEYLRGNCKKQSRPITGKGGEES